MKKYIDFLNEISDVELYDGLVGFGIFANKIPNFLTSEAFLAYTKTLNVLLTDKPKDYIRYSNIRNINVPRALAIPEPFAYASQCKALADNWDKIKQYFSDKTGTDKFKISRIHLRKQLGSKELFEMNYKNFIDDGTPEQDIIIKSKYIACADISNCFPSIYSHSIAWSLVGKSVAKANKNPSNWYNQLDFYTRNIKFGETNGLLIGPHSSNLVSEIILAAVDCELQKQGFNYIRNIDDYSCYVETYEEAERFLLCLSEELKANELSLNHKKSKIIALPQASVSNWVNKLNHFNFTNTYIVKNKEALRVKELKGFIDFAIELMITEKFDVAILNYAIKIISTKHLDTNAKNYYIKHLHHLVLLYPYLINYLEGDVFDTFKIDTEMIKTISNDIYEYGLKKKIFEACSFAVYWALKYDFKINDVNLKEKAISSADCIFMLISYLYDKKHQKGAYLKEYRDEAKRLKRDDFDKYWLYVYEVLSWSDLIEPYKTMRKQGLSFIKNEYK